MKKLFTALFQNFRHLILYGIIGSCSAGLDFIIYTLLVQEIGMQYLAANCISVLVGISVSFMLNRSYNFKVKDHAARRFATFLTIGLLGLVMSNVILYLCIDIWGMHKIVAKLLSIVIVVGMQFLLNKFVTFKPTSHP